MALADNLKIGDVEVYFTVNGTEYFLGQTNGGGTLTIEREFEDLTVDKYGSAPVDKALVGTKLMFQAMLAESTKSNIRFALPEGLYVENAGDDKIGIGTETGKLASTKAGLLRLHPRENNPDNFNDDIYIFKAFSTENIELSYKIDEQRILEVTWEALVDETQPDGQLLGRVGDIDIS